MERTDEQLLQAAREGDADAFAVFYRRHVDAVLAYLRRRTGAPEVAFDLTAETFASAIVGLGSFDPARGAARGWLFAIAANELRQAWRRGQVEDRARRRLHLEPVVLDDEGLEAVEARAGRPGVLESALESLPEAEREAVRAHVVGERPYDVLAQELRCSEQVVRQRVSRGLRKLKAFAEEEER